MTTQCVRIATLMYSSPNSVVGTKTQSGSCVALLTSCCAKSAVFRPNKITITSSISAGGSSAAASPTALPVNWTAPALARVAMRTSARRICNGDGLGFTIRLVWLAPLALSNSDSGPNLASESMASRQQEVQFPLPEKPGPDGTDVKHLKYTWNESERWSDVGVVCWAASGHGGDPAAPWRRRGRRVQDGIAQISQKSTRIGPRAV